MERKLKANIWKYYLFNVFSGFVLFYAIDKIFMEARGLSVTEISLVLIVFDVFFIAFEVPSGAIADRWSRKYVLALNMVFFILNTLLWVLAQDIRLFLLGSLAASVHMAFLSGTDSSFLYDTLKQLNRTGDFEKVLGNSLFWNNLLAIFAGIAGGIIADFVGLEMPFWITIGFSLAAVFIALSFTEPEIHRTTGEMKYWTHIVETGKYLWKHPFIGHITAFWVMMGATLFLMDEYGQLYFKGVGMPIYMLGILGAVGNGIEAVTGKFAWRLSRFSRRKVFTTAIITSIAGFVAVGLTRAWYGVIFAFMPWAAYYTILPLFLNDLHQQLPSGQRATGESFTSLLRSLVFIPLGLGFGIIADRLSIYAAYIAAGIILAAYLVVFVLVSFRRIGGSRTQE
ncbi:MAG: MFS transporter [Dehalococcoidales bacterium]|nr:MFS transporter [Dehalococcoidales bacterium]